MEYPLSPLFNGCIIGAVFIFYLLYRSQKGLQFIYHTRQTEPWKNKYKPIFIFFSALFGASAGFVYFFLGFHTEVFIAYDKNISKNADYSWFWPSDILRFPIDQLKNVHAIEASKLEARKLKPETQTTSVLTHVIILDITGSTKLADKQPNIAADISTAIQKNLKGCKLDADSSFTIADKIPALFVTGMEQSNDFMVVGFYSGDDNLVEIKWDNSNYLGQRLKPCDAQKIYCAELKKQKNNIIKGAEKTDFVKMFRKLSTEIATLGRNDIHLTIISDFKDDINDIDNIKSAINDLAKKKIIKKTNLVKIPIQGAKKQAAGNEDEIPKYINEIFNRNSEVVPLLNLGNINVDILAALLKAKACSTKQFISFYYPKSFLKYENAAKAHFELTDVENNEDLVFEFSANKDVEKDKPVLNLKISEVDSFDLELNGRAVISLPKEAKITASVTPMNYSTEPYFYLNVTSKRTSYQGIFLMDFKPTLSIPSSGYLLALYNCIIASIFIMCLFFQMAVFKKTNRVWWRGFYKYNRVLLILYCIAGCLYMSYIWSLFAINFYSCVIISSSIAIHLFCWDLALRKWYGRHIFSHFKHSIIMPVWNYLQPTVPATQRIDD